ncbi:M15 family metallopeptidase [Nocardia lijiangensis]|uniref:M15 family metallopeptidase n=1 Tax=Nocardia lijiangensis TaxID=299618 RepID=UPI003D75671D
MFSTSEIFGKRMAVAVLAAAAIGGAGAPQALATPAGGHREVIGSAAGTEGLDPALAVAYTLAEDAAHAEGVSLWINSGHRSYAEQQAMWENGIATYGSPEEARRWVLPPEESTHVAGQAIDVGPQLGAQWLEQNGNRWGMCRTFANEWWHFELATIPGGVCPPLRSDASEHQP